MKNAMKIEFDKAMNKNVGQGQVFPVLVMTRPSFPCMKQGCRTVERWGTKSCENCIQ